jgi:predicted CoA-binding protein
MAPQGDRPPLTVLQGVRTIAVVGVSRKKIKFGSSAFRELKKRGYDVYPVHHSMDELDGVKCYRSVGNLPVVPDCVLITVKPESALEVVEQAAAKGIRKAWFQQGADFSEAIAGASQAGLQVVSGRCILMYAEPVTGFHRFHRFLNRLFGKY